MQVNRPIRLKKTYSIIILLVAVDIIFISVFSLIDNLQFTYAFVATVIFGILGFSLLINMIINFKILYVCNEGLIIKKQLYKWSDFRTIHFLPNRNTILSFQFQLDRGSIVLMTHDDKRFNLILNYYQDYNILKFIAFNFDKLKIDDSIISSFIYKIQKTTPNYESYIHDSYKTFNLNFFYVPYFNIILLGLTLTIALKTIDPIVFVTVTVMLIILSGSNFNYFKVSDNFLIIKNYVYFWKSTVFKLEDLSSVNYGLSGKGSIVSGLKVNSNDLRQHFYASGLSRKKIKLMLENIELNKNNTKKLNPPDKN